jgi:hypothetical protein
MAEFGISTMVSAYGIDRQPPRPVACKLHLHFFEIARQLRCTALHKQRKEGWLGGFVYFCFFGVGASFGHFHNGNLCWLCCMAMHIHIQNRKKQKKKKAGRPFPLVEGSGFCTLLVVHHGVVVMEVGVMGMGN